MITSSATTKRSIRINTKSMSAVAASNVGRVASSSSDSSSGSSQVNSINGYDVLLGRGGLTNSHIGNKHFRKVVSEFQPQYLVARKNDKKYIAQRIVERIHAKGGRFLKRTADSEVWSEVTMKKALEKTSQSLRESLDVRHKKFRPEKVFHRQDGDEKNPRKRTRLVQGLVMDSPKLTGMKGPQQKNGSDPADDIPDLSIEEAMGTSSNKFEPLFSFSSQGTDNNPHIGEEDCDNVLEI